MFVIHNTARAPANSAVVMSDVNNRQLPNVENSYRLIRAHLDFFFFSCFPPISSTPFAQIYFSFNIRPLFSCPWVYSLRFSLIYFFKYHLTMRQSFLRFSCAVHHLPFPHLTMKSVGKWPVLFLFTLCPPAVFYPSIFSPLALFVYIFLFSIISHQVVLYLPTSFSPSLKVPHLPKSELLVSHHQHELLNY